MRHIRSIALLLACATVIVLMEDDIRGLGDVKAMGLIDVVFLGIYSILLFGACRLAVRGFRRLRLRD